MNLPDERMAGPTDAELLREFAERGREDAFGQLVGRHLDMVFGVALRRTGDRPLAQEVAQAVFVVLARKAGRLVRRPSLRGWLHCVAVLESAEALRRELRHRRKLEAYMEAQPNASGESIWRDILPVLDEVIGELSDSDRELILLRYFDGRGFQDIGRLLGKTDDAAQKQAERALLKLTRLLGRKGVAVPAAVLSAELALHTALSAPAHLVSSIAGTAVSSAAAGSPLFLSYLIPTMNALKPVTAIVLVAAVAITPWVWQRRALTESRAEVNRLSARLGVLDADLAGANDRLAAAEAEATRARAQANELLTLRAQVAELRAAARTVRAGSERTTQPASPRADPSPSLLRRPNSSVQGMGVRMGMLRRRMLAGETVSPASEMWLAQQAEPLREYEKSSEQLAAFQAAYISSSLGLEENDMFWKIRRLIEEALREEHGQGLDHVRRPDAPEALVARVRGPREELDQRTKLAVAELLPEPSRTTFEREFTGVLDLTTGTTATPAELLRRPDWKTLSSGEMSDGIPMLPGERRATIFVPLRPSSTEAR